MPAHPYWPLFDVVVRTPRLELRLPRDEELVELARLAAGGIHDPAVMPFAVPWTDAPSPALERSALQWWWRARAEWSPERWTFTGAVFVEGAAGGVQDLLGVDFPTLRAVSSGSWLGRAYQGRGLGKEMRAAVLHLAFEGLGATVAYSGAWEDNLASLAVSRAVGYVENGLRLLVRRGKPVRHIDLRLDRAGWEERRRDDITVEGLEGALEMFGAAGPSAAGAAGAGER